jgi:hypothetical protein
MRIKSIGLTVHRSLYVCVPSTACSVLPSVDEPTGGEGT